MDGVGFSPTSRIPNPFFHRQHAPQTLHEREQVERANKLVIALPDKNPAVVMITQVKELAKEKGVEIKRFETKSKMGLFLADDDNPGYCVEDNQQ